MSSSLNNTKTDNSESGAVDLARLVSVCVKAGQGASSIIMEIYEKGSLGLVDKGNGIDSFTGRPMDDPQTEADRRAEAYIFNTLKREVPNLDPKCLIGEESEEGESKDNKEEAEEAVKDVNVESATSGNDCVFPNEVLKKWPDDLRFVPSSSIALWIDPLDGTAEFTRGHLESVTTLIGISVNGKSTAGVIVKLIKSETFLGVVGVGDFHTFPGQGNLEPIYRPKRAEEDYEKDGLQICTTRTKTAPVVVAAFDNLGPKTVTLRHGGAGRKFLDVLTGVADAYLYPRPGTKSWDSCAGEALLTALGGNVTDAIGNRIEYEIYNNNTTDDDKLTNGADHEHPYLNGYGVVASIRGYEFHYQKLLPAVYKAVADYAPQFPLSEERRSEASSYTLRSP